MKKKKQLLNLYGCLGISINGSEQKLIFTTISPLCRQIHQAVPGIHYCHND